MTWQIKILQFLAPVIRWIGKVHLPFTVKRMTGREYFQCRDILQPGDIILSATYGHLSNLVNPEKWGHAALYCGLQENKVAYVLEAIGKGVVKTDLITHILSKDEFCVVKAASLTKYRRLKIKEDAIEQYEGLEYDFLFRKGDKSLYCYELCADVLMNYCPALKIEMSDEFMGHRYYGEKSFINNTDDFELVFNTRGK